MVKERAKWREVSEVGAVTEKEERWGKGSGQDAGRWWREVLESWCDKRGLWLGSGDGLN